MKLSAKWLNKFHINIIVVFLENIHTPSTEDNGNLILCVCGGGRSSKGNNFRVPRGGVDPGLFRGLQLQRTVTLLLGGVSKQLSYGIVDEHSGRKYSRRSWKFQGWGWSKTKVPSVGRGGRVWIFSGTTHDDVLLLELSANYFKL